MVKNIHRKPKASPKTMSAGAQPLIDKKWQARSDMQTLKEANEIMSNKSRHTAAKREAKAHMDALGEVVKK